MQYQKFIIWLIYTSRVEANVMKNNCQYYKIAKTSLFHQMLALYNGFYHQLLFPACMRVSFFSLNNVDVRLGTLPFLWNKKKPWSLSGFCCWWRHLLVMSQISLSNASRKCLSLTIFDLIQIFYVMFIWPLATLLKPGIIFETYCT